MRDCGRLVSTSGDVERILRAAANDLAAAISAAKPTPSEGLAADVEAVLTLLEEHEWAEHCTKTPLGQRLEAAITEMHNEIHEAEDHADAAAPAAPAVDAGDTARMDWLETQVVNVRAPLRYGSRDLFWASPEEVDGGPDGPSDLRARIDAAQAAAKGEHGQ